MNSGLFVLSWMLPTSFGFVAPNHHAHSAVTSISGVGSRASIRNSEFPLPLLRTSTTLSSDAASDQLVSASLRWERIVSYSRASLVELHQRVVTEVAPVARTEIQSQALPARALAPTSHPMPRRVPRSLGKLVRRYWWSLPLALCLVPLYASFVGHSPPSTPSWWKLVNLESFWLESPADTLSTHSLMSAFLWSNVSYLLAGLYLLRRYPMLKARDSAVLCSSRASLLSPFAPLLSKYVPSRGTWLALWLLLSGFVSTLFHAVQAYGDYAIAEGWCYLDHGVAISATMYYLQYCKAPQRLTLVVGGLGVALLALPLPGYLFLHSTWHLLSAAAAALWATQPSARRRARLEKSLVGARA
jgi:hypothetical protein